MTAGDLERVYRYHEGRSTTSIDSRAALGYLDWASQPRPVPIVRGGLVAWASWLGSGEPTATTNSRAAGVTGASGPLADPEDFVSYDRLLSAPPIEARPLTRDTLGTVSSDTRWDCRRGRWFSRVALVAARQSFERQSPPHGRRMSSSALSAISTPARGRAEATARSGTTRPTGMSSSGAGCLPRTPGRRWRSAGRRTGSWWR